MLGPNDLCLCCGTIARASFEELLEATVAGGFSGLSVWPRHYESALASGLSDRDMRHMLEDRGLAITEVDALLNWLPQAEYRVEVGGFSHGEDMFFRIADVLAARSVNVACVSPVVVNAEAAAEAFSGVCDRAAQHGLKVSLEFLPWSGIPDAKTALEIVQRADRPNGGVMVDTWHHFRSGHSAEELLALPGEVIVGVQINDAASQAAENIVYESMHGRLLPGEGAIDLVQAIRALDAIGSQAPIGVEVFSDELRKLPPVEAARKVGDAARAIIAKARTRDN